MNLDKVTIEKKDNSLFVEYDGPNFVNGICAFWVAEIIDSHPKYMLRRDFINVKSEATITRDGYYQIFSNGTKFTFKYVDGLMSEMTEKEIVEEIKEAKVFEIKSLIVAFRRELREYYTQTQKLYCTESPIRKQQIENSLTARLKSLREIFGIDPKFPHFRHKNYAFTTSRKN